MHVIMDSSRMDTPSEPTDTELGAASTLNAVTCDASELPLPLVRKQAYSTALPSHNTPDLLHRNVGSQEGSISACATTDSPQISYKPRHAPTGNVYSSSADARGRSLGAVARLAIDGGLSPEHLSHIGHSGYPTHSSAPATSVPQVRPSEIHSSSHPSRSGLIIPARSKFGSPVSSVIPHTYCSYRHVHQPTRRCITYQGINLTRAAPFEYTGTPPCNHIWHHQCSVYPRKYHVLHTCATKTDPLPLQMTRVGGLVINPATVSVPAPSEHQVNFSRLIDKHVSYQSVSACASPTSFKHSGLPSSHATFFSSATCTPSSANTPPPPLPSSANSFGDIVRLGPGDTVTRAAPGETSFNVTDLIRMHDCPQPYISMCSVGDEDLNASSPSNLYGEYGVDFSPLSPVSSSRPEVTDSGYPADVSCARVSNTEPCYFDRDHAVPPATTLPNPPIQPPTKPAVFSVPGTQVARTMRYLRRIRHIFGDSLGYTSSVTSASTGALAISEKNTNSTSSMVELRSHEGRSMEPMRPASYSCNCAFESTPSGHEREVPSQPCLTRHFFDYVDALVRFNQSPGTPSTEPTSWTCYHVKIVDKVLILTHAGDHQDQSSECLSKSQPNHMHIPLCDADVTWNPLSEHFVRQLQIFDRAMLRERGIIFSASSHELCISTPEVKCFLLMNWELAAKRFGFELPRLPKATTSKGATDRSCSLGIAGPPGAIPLFRAVGTAAASVGLPAIGRTSVSSLFHISNFQKPSGVSNVPSEECSHPSDWRMYGTKSGVRNLPEGAEKPSSVRKQLHSNHGCFHQAFTRIRRVAASTDTSSNSAQTSCTTSNVPTTSSHAASSLTKSDMPGLPDISVPCSDVPSCRLAEMKSELPSTTSSHLSSEPFSSNLKPFSLAASVSPTPSLRSPYLTIASPSIDLGSTVGESSSGLDSHSSVQPSLDYDWESHKLPSSTGAHSTSSEGGAPASTDASVSVESTRMTAPSETKLNERASAFIPLPLSPSGHLALHKCPRSTLSPFVPFVVELCVTLVEQYGLNCVGLYRLSGSKVAHDFISTELQKALQEIDVHSDKWNDIHAVCGVLKTFLRNLPDSLFPKVMYTDFLAACRLSQREKRLLSIQRLLGIMECYPHHPEYRAHRATLRYLATHLARVSAREAVNKMTAYNLALVFAPNLVQPCEDTPELLMSDSKFKILLVETVIKYHAWIFSPDLGLESGCSIPPDSVEDLSLAISGAPSELELLSRSPTDPSALAFSNATPDSEDPANQPGRLEGDVRPLIAGLLRAAADLPPPPSDTDLETAEEPGPSSDRPSDIAMLVQRPRFTSIPTSAWSVAALRSLDQSCFTDSTNSHPELILTREIDLDTPIEKHDSEVSSECLATSGVSIKPRPFTTQLGSKLDSLRHLSQGCLDHYTSEARELGVRVAENRRHLQNTVAQRLYAEQLLHEARSQFADQLAPVTQSSLEITESCLTEEDHIQIGGPTLPKPDDDIAGPQQ